MTVVFGGFVVNAAQYVVAESTALAHVAPAAFCLTVMMVLQLGFFATPTADVRNAVGYAALVVQAAVVLGPIALYGEGWTGMPGFLAGDVLLVLRPPAGWVLFALIAAANGYAQYRLTDVPLEAVYITTLTAVIGLVVYGLSRLRGLVRELADARSELAGLAVARERLRFARDLHDLLGFSLSAVTLKAELAYRLVPGRKDHARRELAEILDISRQALADVRAVASSYRELSLDDELASARSVLTAAEVVVSVRCTAGELPTRTRTVLATVVREGVTNLLRHSKAETCDIVATATADGVSIEIVNDGVRPVPEERPDGNGIRNLTARVEALGGTLTAGPGPDDTYRLHAVVPHLSEDGDQADATPDPRRGQAMAPRIGTLIATAVFTGYAVIGSVFVVVSKAEPAGQVFAEACVLASLALVLGFFSRPEARVRSPLGYALLGVLALVTYLPGLLLADPYLGLHGLLAGSLLVALRARVGLPLFFAVVVSAGVIHLLEGGGAINVTYGFLVTVNHGLVVFALSRLRSMVSDLHEARSELADLAVTGERLRFARDLHDLLGYSLSAITLKTELTQRLVDRDPGRAQQELSGILDVSRQALADVRAVATSYRELSLDEEISSARDLLTASDIAVTVRVEPVELPPDVRTVLATVLREGIANLLRHSHATRCGITLAHEDGVLVLDVVNDGVRRAGGTTRARVTAAVGGSGSGIRNLTVRVTGVGGTLCAGVEEDDVYRLRAEIPR
ncbi:sensor histidine kinase [Saccharothrix violaceirubra]|uniref:Signal transduction histidine kinase n=1 Tax=Saccharothrix violaceirubra TaxID=413306 RepID=A0A7W7WXR6_9PSEU|nr:histidine kinase [Saccharothrix violaceirubra]MBB4967351.1 signal transduction histidine kinase [Saccharothrix violaceirubra]